MAFEVKYLLEKCTSVADPTCGNTLEVNKLDIAKYVEEANDEGYINIGGGSGATNLSNTASATTVTVESDTGTDTIVAAATTSLAGVMTAADKTKLDNLSNAEPQIKTFTTANYTVVVTYFGASDAEIICLYNAGTFTITTDSPILSVHAFVDDSQYSTGAVNGNLTFVFEGTGISGNTAITNAKIPTVQKTNASAYDIGGAPSTGNPYPINYDSSNPITEVVGIGNGGNSSVSIRLKAITFTKIFLTFTGF